MYLPRSLVTVGIIATASSIVCGHVALAAIPDHVNPLVAAVTVDPVPTATTIAPAEEAPIAPAVQTVSTDAPVAAEPAASTLDPREIECVAKVIVHEAGNQPHRGQVAVAQVIRTRMKSGRFADSACGVVKQPRQFFNVDAYNPSRSDARWSKAVDIAVHTLNGKGEDVAPGALFFHSAGATMPSRTRVVQIAEHTFYR